ncbi:MAG: hypothetical protein AUI14_16315 [Actinobacteria bacterium 13_2_20CM_2_71_6]|nr:MAG: hypothetical protein AUI14_16315 [Actinobacteria bacterium 13_2_20CM_2_71_6]
MRRVVFGILGVAVGTSLLVGAKSHQPGPAATMPVARAGAAHLPAGTYLVTGSIERTPHGLVQLRIGVVGGRFVDITVLRMPVGGRSTEINQRAVPVLRREALAAQSAQIDAVSGATNTSRGYARSLQAALDAAVHGVRG